MERARRGIDRGMGADFAQLPRGADLDDQLRGHRAQQPALGACRAPHQIDFRGNLKKKAQVDLKLNFNSDILMDFMGEVSPVIDLFISNFDAPLKISFDHNSKFFYNFIVPTENADVAVRFEQFLKIYQTLKK